MPDPQHQLGKWQNTWKHNTQESQEVSPFQGFRFFSRLVGRSDPWSNGGSFSEMMGSKPIRLTTVDIWVIYFTYTITQTLVCIYLYIDCWLYSKTCLKQPLKKEDQDLLSLNAGWKYCRMLQGEHSAILSTFIKLPFFIKIFVLPFCVAA